MNLRYLVSTSLESPVPDSINNPEVTTACQGFLEQVLPLAPLEGVAVVLLDDGATTSRVVASWQSPETKAGNQQYSAEAANLVGLQEIDSSYLTLAGSSGTMGAVLIRVPENAGPLDLGLFHDAVQLLAGRLEECSLRQRLERSDLEAKARSRITSPIAEGSVKGFAIKEAYQWIVDEIKGLVVFDRLTIFLVHPETGLLESGFQSDGEGQTLPVNAPRPLSGTGCERLMSDPKCQIVDDLLELSGDIWPELSGAPEFRSAIVAPLVKDGEVFGAAVVRNLYPKAFGRADESLICRVVDLLNPAILDPVISQARGDQPSPLNAQLGSRELSDIVAVGNKIDDMLDPFARAAQASIQFDSATVTWLNRNGYDIHSCRFGANTQSAGNPRQRESTVIINAPLHFAGEHIGTLALSRNSRTPFNENDLNALNMLAAHMSVAVENDRRSQQSVSQGRESMADLAHALRTPLSSIKGYSSSLLQPDISWPKEVFKEFLETINREADRLNRVIDDLLDTVEAPRAELRLDRSVTTVETLLRLAEAQLITSESWNKVFRFLPPGGQSFVLVDQTRMTQVLVYLLKCAAGSSPQDSDLLLNAISSEGGIEISVRVTPQVIGQRGIDVLAGGVAYRDGVDSPQDQLDDALRLSVCRTLLAAHDVELDMPDAADPARLYRFIPPVLAHNR